LGEHPLDVGERNHGLVGVHGRESGDDELLGEDGVPDSALGGLVQELLHDVGLQPHRHPDLGAGRDRRNEIGFGAADGTTEIDAVEVELRLTHVVLLAPSGTG
jgi:hypothetical protein